MGNRELFLLIFSVLFLGQYNSYVFNDFETTYCWTKTLPSGSIDFAGDCPSSLSIGIDLPVITAANPVRGNVPFDIEFEVATALPLTSSPDILDSGANACLVRPALCTPFDTDYTYTTDATTGNFTLNRASFTGSLTLQKGTWVMITWATLTSGIGLLREWKFHNYWCVM